MEYQSFKFGGRPHNSQSHRQTITPEEFQRRFEFYKKKYETEKKAREEALANQKEMQKTPETELREQPLGTEPEQKPIVAQERANEENINEHIEPQNEEKSEEELLEVDRLYLQRDTEAEDNPRIMSPAFEKLHSAAQGKRPRR